MTLKMLAAGARRKWWLVLPLSIVLLAVIVEFGLRLTTGLGVPVLYQNDQACGYLPTPDQDVRRFGSRNAINHFSQRSDPLPAAKAAGHYRILLIGDSVTYGTTFVHQKDIFASILARELPDRLHRPIDVMNASAGGWAVSNEVGYLTSRGTFGADLVVFVLNTEDLNQPFNFGALSLKAGYPDHLPLCAIAELWERYLEPRLFRGAPVRDAGSVALPSDQITDVKNVLASLSQAKKICDAANARMAIALSPFEGEQWREAPYPASLNALAVWIETNHIPFLNLHESFAKAPVADVYFDGEHLRSRGNLLAAAALEEWLVSNIDAKRP